MSGTNNLISGNTINLSNEGFSNVTSALSITSKNVVEANTIKLVTDVNSQHSITIGIDIR
ncbi:MAG: hypothetical protein JO166_14620 [Deltaproteobacteria bacterium]|nr:hypothetical protein [Deltaproteobacteria bacterium]